MTDTVLPTSVTEPVLLHGDCLELLTADALGYPLTLGYAPPLIPDASIDAVVTDPPYGLGFMGKAWDALPPGQEWAEACLRVLKPGGHLIAFGGTRTWHRLACAVEDAGFEIRDSIAWLYGCHDDQTEVLTRRGWVNGLDLTAEDDVAQWATDGTVSLVRPTARQRYLYDGDLLPFRNADVDQLVTPNHRVYRQTYERTMRSGKRVGSWSGWQVDQAADINRWQPMRLPAAGVHDGPGIGGTDYAALLGWVWAEGGFDPSGSGVRVYQSSVNQPFVDEIAALLDRLGPHKRYDYRRTWKGRGYTASTWYVSGDLARRVRADLPGKSPTYELLWRMTADEKRAMWDAAMKGDGSKAARSFWQKSRTDLEWAQTLLACIGHRGKVADDPRGVLHWTDRPTVELQRRHLAAAPVPYFGEVWCVTVPSGAFLVRRNGRVSVSGNSGFPKGQNVGAAVERALADTNDPYELLPDEQAFCEWMRDSSGVTEADARRVLGSARFVTGRVEVVNAGTTAAPVRARRAMVPTAAAWETLRPLLREQPPAWVEALVKSPPKPAPLEPGQAFTPGRGEGTASTGKWAGWNTSLKPAFEPAVVGRKPFPGTVAGNVLEHGTGALNIDACRVGDTGGARLEPGTVGYNAGTVNALGGNLNAVRSPKVDGLGRWPANVVLDEDVAASLDEQVGTLTSGANPTRRSSDKFSRDAYGDFAGQEDCTPARGADAGGPSRFMYTAKAPASERIRLDGQGHPTVKPLDLMRWLVRLVTPPGGIVLEPFAGSGTTIEACVLEGMRCLAIERDDGYLPLIRQRINRQLDPVAYIETAGEDLGLFAELDDLGGLA